MLGEGFKVTVMWILRVWASGFRISLVYEPPPLVCRASHILISVSSHYIPSIFALHPFTSCPFFVPSLFPSLLCPYFLFNVSRCSHPFQLLEGWGQQLSVKCSLIGPPPPLFFRKHMSLYILRCWVIHADMYDCMMVTSWRSPRCCRMTNPNAECANASYKGIFPIGGSRLDGGWAQIHGSLANILKNLPYWLPSCPGLQSVTVTQQGWAIQCGKWKALQQCCFWNAAHPISVCSSLSLPDRFRGG